jgi:hypothetical protein
MIEINYIIFMSLHEVAARVYTFPINYFSGH